ncbi:MAG: tetratricopeptide repeat protein [Kiritimatiellia bacterium]
MSRPIPFRFLRRLALAALLLLPGCMRSTARIEEKEENHPRYREGKARMQQGEFDNAIKTFESLLRENPSMARPHLELGVLYDERKKDYVRAIYHYQSYLELRPKATSANGWSRRSTTRR